MGETEPIRGPQVCSFGFFYFLDNIYRLDARIRISESERSSLLTENNNGDKVTALSVDCGPGDDNVSKQSHPDRQLR